MRSRQSLSYSKFAEVFRNPKTHYRAHKIPPLIHILSQMNQSIPPHPISLISILILFSHLRLGLFSFDFPTQILHKIFFSPMRATCAAHFILLDFIILIISDEEYKLRSSSLYNFYRPPIISSFIGPNRPLCALFSDTLSVFSSHKGRDDIQHS
jgi:hypothetical protein